jgi:hypothetical protein
VQAQATAQERISPERLYAAAVLLGVEPGFLGQLLAAHPTAPPLVPPPSPAAVQVTPRILGLIPKAAVFAREISRKIKNSATGVGPTPGAGARPGGHAGEDKVGNSFLFITAI